MRRTTIDDVMKRFAPKRSVSSISYQKERKTNERERESIDDATYGSNEVNELLQNHPAANSGTRHDIDAHFKALGRFCKRHCCHTTAS